MRILAFETSAKAASVALTEDGALVAEYYQNSGQTHSRTVSQMAQDLLANCDLNVRDLDAAAVAAGPGSFTGVRIGMAAAKGLCWGAELPLYGVSTLEAMARGYGETDAAVLAVMDARRSQVYAGGFYWSEGRLCRLLPDCAISLQELELELKKWERKKILVGDGALLCYNTINGPVENIELAPEHRRLQRAVGVALAAMEQAKSGISPSAARLVPNYLRLSQAERERQERLQKT